MNTLPKIYIPITVTNQASQDQSHRQTILTRSESENRNHLLMKWYKSNISILKYKVHIRLMLRYKLVQPVNRSNHITV